MHFNNKSIVGSSVLLIVLSLIPEDVHAYIDPGSGSMILQLLLAGVAGAAMACKLYWRRFLSFFRRNPSSTDSSDNK